MIVILQTTKIKTLADVETFLAGNESVDYQLTERDSTYHWLSNMLVARPNHPAATVIVRDRPHRRSPQRTDQAVREVLHRRGHPSVGRNRHPPQYAVWPSHPQTLRTDVLGLWCSAFRAIGQHFQRPLVQSAPTSALPKPTHQLQ